MNPSNVIEHDEHDPACAGPRALSLLGMRQGLSEPIQAVAALSKRLLEDTPAELIEDIRKMHDGAERLLKSVRAATESTTDMTPVDFNAYIRGVRHGLRNELVKVDGFCQLLELREQSDGFGAFGGDLQKIRELCRDFNHMLYHVDDPIPVTLPCESVVSARHVSKPLQAAQENSPIGKLLVVDDSPSAREVLYRLLKPYGHSVEVAENGAKALEMMASESFDVVLLDTMMPEIDGIQVLQHLKAQPDMRHPSVIFISGIENVDYLIRCIELGAEDYLTKPIDHRLLQARVKACLIKRQLYLRELQQFFPAKVAEDWLHRKKLLREGREADVSVLFCDVRGFSRISENHKLGPGEMVKWLSDVMEKLSECVLENDGVVVDFEGDQILAMWGAPVDQVDHAERACSVALKMLAHAQELSRKWESIIGTATEFGIGINSGRARVGNTGSERRLKYGPLGNTVNLGSRVQGATKYFRTNLLISEATKRHLDERFAVRRVATVKVVNIDTPVELYELSPSGKPHWTGAKMRYEHALSLFESRQLDEAFKIVAALTAEKGCHGPEFWLLSRTIECMTDANKWSREWVLPGK